MATKGISTSILKKGNQGAFQPWNRSCSVQGAFQPRSWRKGTKGLFNIGSKAVATKGLFNLDLAVGMSIKGLFNFDPTVALNLRTVSMILDSMQVKRVILKMVPVEVGRGGLLAGKPRVLMMFDLYFQLIL